MIAFQLASFCNSKNDIHLGERSIMKPSSDEVIVEMFQVLGRVLSLLFCSIFRYMIKSIEMWNKTLRSQPSQTYHNLNAQYPQISLENSLRQFLTSLSNTVNQNPSIAYQQIVSIKFINLRNKMSRSEPKPKIIYRNLEEIVNKSNINKQPKNLRHNSQRSGSGEQWKKRTNNNSEEKKKTKYISKHIKTQVESVEVSSMYTQWFNQIDAIFTQLEDYILLSKEKVLKNIRETLQRSRTYRQTQNKIQDKIGEVNKMSEYIKHIVNYFIENQIPSFDSTKQNTNILSQLNDISFINPQSRRQITENPVALTEICDNTFNDSKVLELSMKNTKSRANRRSEAVINRKKTVYELILEQKCLQAQQHHNRR